MTDLFVKLKIHEEQNLPYVIFCKPDSDKIIGVFQKNDHLYFVENFEEKGFVFASFEADTLPYIPQNNSDIYVERINSKDYFFENEIQNNIDEYAKINFESIVKKALDCIEKNDFKKVVVSRKETHELKNFDIEIAFKKMIFQYRSAFKYCFYHPKIGKWMGATPEQFIKINSNTIQTVALAATQSVNGAKKPIWSDKETHEQQLVTEFIINSLDDFIKEITISTPYSVKAGNLWHIKTDIFAKIKTKKSLKNVISVLHPTSAVCGLPKESAKDFILKNEGYEREYYSGFLGELNIDLATFATQKSDLFVNLRCMKVTNTTAELFIGCGIVKDSIPSDEFIETVNKSMVMRKIV